MHSQYNQIYCKCIIHYNLNVRASSGYCILESIIQYILKVLGSVFQNDARILAHRVDTKTNDSFFRGAEAPEGWDGWSG